MKSELTHPSSLILQTFFQKFDLFADAPNAETLLRFVQSVPSPKAEPAGWRY